MRLARTANDSTLSAEEFRGALIRLGWTQAEFARRVAMSPITVSRWATGEIVIPGWVTRYLEVLGDLADAYDRHIKREGS